MKTDNFTGRVLDSANRVAGTNLSLPPDGDLPLEAFGFDSLTFFAFVLDLERSCGIKFDDTLLNHERLRSIRLAAALMHSLCATSEAGNREGVENRIEP
jgi:acyl carrier protein